MVDGLRCGEGLRFNRLNLPDRDSGTEQTALPRPMFPVKLKDGHRRGTGARLPESTAHGERSTEWRLDTGIDPAAGDALSWFPVKRESTARVHVPREGDSDSRETERGMISRRSDAVAVTDIVAQYVQGTKKSTPAPSLAQGWCGEHVSRETSMNGPVLRSPAPVPSQPNASRGSAEHSACSAPSSTDATWSRRVRTSCTRGTVQGMRTS